MSFTVKRDAVRVFGLALLVTVGLQTAACLETVCAPGDTSCGPGGALAFLLPRIATGAGAGDPGPHVSGGTLHTCMRLETGAVRCWGNANAGRLGYANAIPIGDDETPASAGDVDIGGSVLQVSAGDTFSCALLTTGGVRCWGDGQGGQTGYGNVAIIGDNETPASAGDIDLGGRAVEISVGRFHSCARMDTGAVRCWGYNVLGQLGYGNTINIGDNETPASAGEVNLGGAATQIACGESFSCAVMSTGAVRCWGQNAFGKLGYGGGGNIGDDEVPASAGDVNVGGAATRVVTGCHFACALLASGEVRCWGDNFFGQLGYGNTTNIGDDEVPSSVTPVNVGGVVRNLSAGDSHVCALLDGGALRCWGFGANGRLGYADTQNIGDDEAPASSGNINFGGAALQVDGGNSHTCALLDNGVLRCWGLSNNGQLGYGNIDAIGDDETPASAGDVIYR
jgi:alpha-tubulin suppressor-like RCC1 family protein